MSLLLLVLSSVVILAALLDWKLKMMMQLMVASRQQLKKMETFEETKTVCSLNIAGFGREKE